MLFLKDNIKWKENYKGNDYVIVVTTSKLRGDKLSTVSGFEKWSVINSKVKELDILYKTVDAAISRLKPRKQWKSSRSTGSHSAYRIYRTDTIPQFVTKYG